MKVRRVNVVDALGRPTLASAWLTVGTVYHVLSVVFDTHSLWWLRLVSDETSDVGVFGLEQFEIVSARVPATWIVSWSSGGAFELSPAAWLAQGFWERYFEHDDVARDIFERERNMIIALDP